MFVSVGLGDPKVRPKGVADGLPVNIPVLVYFRFKLGHDEVGYSKQCVEHALFKQ